MEIAAFNFTPALLRVEKYMRDAKTAAKGLDHPLYYVSKSKIGGHEDVWVTYWDALTHFRSIISHYLHDGNVLTALTPAYKKWRGELEKLEGDDDAGHVIKRYRLTTNLFLIHEMVEDMVQGKSPEPE